MSSQEHRTDLRPQSLRDATGARRCVRRRLK